jgi:hypothetical protein
VLACSRVCSNFVGVKSLSSRHNPDTRRCDSLHVASRSVMVRPQVMHTHAIAIQDDQHHSLPVSSGGKPSSQALVADGLTWITPAQELSPRAAGRLLVCRHWPAFRLARAVAAVAAVVAAAAGPAAGAAACAGCVQSPAARPQPDLAPGTQTPSLRSRRAADTIAL